MKQNQKIMVGLLLLVFALAKVVMLVWWKNQSAPTQSTFILKTCEVAISGCSFGENAHFQLRGVQKNDSIFRIQAKGLSEKTQQVFASFSMSDMDMGFNRFDLKKQADGSWQAENIRLPLCTQARHDWLVEWTIDDGQAEQKYQAHFQTQP